MAKIPKFKTLEEAAEFWDTHDFEDYVDDTEPVTITVRIPRRKRCLTQQMLCLYWHRRIVNGRDSWQVWFRSSSLKWR
jgi:hypothetical protein